MLVEDTIPEGCSRISNMNTYLHIFQLFYAYTHMEKIMDPGADNKTSLCIAVEGVAETLASVLIVK